jgi:uncharacterized protein (TIGR00255 family)
MIQSMTGFGKAQSQHDWGSATVEVRAINSKSLDFKMRVPSKFSPFEAEIKNMASNSLFRGKVDILLTIVSSNGSQSRVDLDLAKHYYQEISKLADALQVESNGKLEAILRLPDVIKSEEGDVEEGEWAQVRATIQQALNGVVEFRKMEGANLEKDLTDCLVELRNNLREIEALAPERIETRRKDLQKKIEEADISDLDEGRFEQEILYFIEKLDINEEIVRLKSHCDYFEEILNAPKSQGRKLGFIAQEMGREINTIGSKANHSGIQKLVVGMKDELEKIKEQSLNVL